MCVYIICVYQRIGAFGMSIRKNILVCVGGRERKRKSGSLRAREQARERTRERAMEAARVSKDRALFIEDRALFIEIGLFS